LAISQALASSAFLKNSDPIDFEWPPADMPSLQPSPAHPCPYSFDDEIPFEFCDSAEDDRDGPPEWPASIKILLEADELDVEMVELVEEMAHGPGDPV
jgi:hypothetical protein